MHVVWWVEYASNCYAMLCYSATIVSLMLDSEMVYHTTLYRLPASPIPSSLPSHRVVRSSSSSLLFLKKPYMDKPKDAGGRILLVLMLLRQHFVLDVYRDWKLEPHAAHSTAHHPKPHGFCRRRWRWIPPRKEHYRLQLTASEALWWPFMVLGDHLVLLSMVVRLFVGWFCLAWLDSTRLCRTYNH